MKKNKLLFSFISVMLMLTLSCTNEEESIAESIKSGTVTGSVGDNSRLISYLQSNSEVYSQTTRSNTTFPTAPSIPADVIDMVANNYKAWEAKENTNYLVPSGEVWNSQIQLRNNTNYYVAGEITFSSYGSGGTVYILPGGKITIDGGLNNVSVECWGEATFDKFTLNNGCSFKHFSSSSLEFEKVSIQGNFTSYGLITAKEMTLSGQGVAELYHDLEITKSFEITNSYKARFEGCVSAQSLSIGSNAYADFNSCVTIEGDAHFTNNAFVSIRSAFLADNLDLGGSTEPIKLYANSLVKCEGKISLPNNTSKFYNYGDEYAVITCAEFIIHQNQIDRLGGGPINLVAGIVTNRTGANLDWTSNVVFNQDTYIAPNACHPGFGTEPERPQPEYVLEHHGAVASPAIDRISATSIDFHEGSAFVSWHERGEGYQGYIDMFNLSQMNIQATFYSNELDFNHIYVNQDCIYATGGRKAGAFYSSLDYNTSVGEITVELVKAEGASGNCILATDNNDLWLVSGSNGGITLGNADFIQLSDAKYVVKHGDVMAVLAGIEQSVVYEYDMSGQPLTSYNVGSIAPANGKNTMASDGTTLYVALGYGGLKAYRDGIEVGSFQEADQTLNPAVNGVDVDENFVYVANGNAGLYILDKNDLSVVKSYVLGDASANFVKKGDDGLIYVAYGLKGVHVFKLTTI